VVPDYSFWVMPVHSREGVVGSSRTRVGNLTAPGLRTPTWWNLGFTQSHSPTPLIYQEQKGVDAPFNDRYASAVQHPKGINLLSNRRIWNSALLSTRSLGNPLTIINAEATTPDTSPLLPIRKLTSRPPGVFERMGWLKKLGVARISKDELGRFTPLIPATTYTSSSCRVVTRLQQHLLETVSGTTFPSGLWSTSEVEEYLHERVAKFIEETEIIQEITTINVSSGLATYDLPEDLLTIKRLAFKPTGGTWTVLTRSDPFQLDNDRTGWETDTGIPFAYVEEPLSDYLSITLAPVPSTGGILHLTYVKSYTIALSTCENLPVPNLFEAYIMWGVLADMLKKDGEAHDPVRAEYCESRFQEGMELAKLFFPRSV